MGVAESLTDKQLANQMYGKEQVEEERRQRKCKSSDALACNLGQEQNAANRSSDWIDEGGRTGVGSNGREMADVGGGAGPDTAKRQRLSSYEAYCVSSPTPPAPTRDAAGRGRWPPGLTPAPVVFLLRVLDDSQQRAPTLRLGSRV